MPECPITRPADLLPHSGRMVLLDQVLSYDDHNLHATATLRPDCLLLPPGSDRLPAWMGMEIMAQGIGAWAGARALDQGQPVRLGFLLGTRKLQFGVPDIPVGTVLDVRTALSWQDSSGMGVFDCSLSCRQAAPGSTLAPDALLLAAALNVFSPASDEILQQTLAG
ncbi:MAG: thioester dehydrase [Eikenella sp.]|nr:thioester dehydrase [Eikenella sp.]